MENYQLLLNLCSYDISMWALQMRREATALASGERTHTMHINNLKSPDVPILELSHVKSVALFPNSEGVKLQSHHFPLSGNAYPCWDDSARLSCAGLAQLPPFLSLQISPQRDSEWGRSDPSGLTIRGAFTEVVGRELLQLKSKVYREDHGIPMRTKPFGCRPCSVWKTAYGWFQLSS